MAGFRYLCLSAQGEEVRGYLEAPDAGQARATLRSRGLSPLEIESGTETAARGSMLAGLGFALRCGLGVRMRDMQTFYRQMQLMLRAGHTLLEALEASGRLAERPRLALALERCAERISAGSSFSAAVAKETTIFPNIAVKLIEAGEQSGELDAVFERLSALTERRADIRRQLTTALTYPSIVALLAGGVVAYLVHVVVPRFAAFLQARGKALPWAASFLLDAADWLSTWGIPLVFTIIATLVLLAFLRRSQRFALHIDTFVLHVPLLGSTVLIAAMAQASWTFSLLLKSRLTVLEALRSVSQVTGNAALAHAFERGTEQVLEGRTIAQALQRHPLPHLLRHMAAIGERSGEMETVMEAMGSHYQKELDTRVKLLSSMIEPVLTLITGAVVGFVYYAFFQAVLTVSTGG